MIKARIKTIPIKQWMVGREMNRRIKKKFDFSSIASWVKEDYKMDLEIGTQTNWNKLLIGEPFVCGMIDAKGRVLFIPDPIEVRNRYLGIF